MKTQRRLVVLEEEDQSRLRDALTEHGEDEVSETLGVSRLALLRGAAGLGVLRGTRASIVAALDDLAPDDDDEEESEDDVEDDDADLEELDS